MAILSPPLSGASDLTAEQQVEVQRVASRDIARRGLLGAIVYAFVLAVLGFITPLDDDYPVIYFAALVVMVVAGLARFALLQAFDTLYTRGSRQWNLGNAIAIAVTAATWGGIAGLSVYEYGVAWTSMLMIVITAGLSAGALSSMAMRLPLLWLYLVLMFAPSLIASFTLSAPHSIGLVFVFLSYLAYHMVQGRNMNRDYWEALINTMRLDAHARQQLHDLTYHDLMTGLPNRALFSDRLHQAVLDARRAERLVGVITLNLDRFMNINDTLGHEAGDELLRQVARILKNTLRDADTLSRLGADNFAVVLPNQTQARDLAKVAQKMSDALAQPLNLRGLDLFLTASMGIAVYPRDGLDTEQLLRNAEAATARVKTQGGNGYQFYEAEMNAQAMERLTMEVRLRRALERKEFVLHYQPKIALGSGHICGVEALLRWQPSTGELVPPDQFIPLLEDTGLIVPVGEWVLRTACADARRWMESGIRDVSIAVNLSVRQFRDPGLAELIESTLQENNLTPDQIELEITESLLMDSSTYVRDTLSRLEAMRLSLAIDDFGTGYSSLGYLKRLPIRTLKIDRTFVKDATTVPADAELIQAIIALAHRLNLRVVAEGVETGELAHFLANNHCDEMQGYYFSKPLPFDSMTPLLAREQPIRTNLEAIQKVALLQRNMAKGW